MNITILSDLNWESHLRSITAREVKNFTKACLTISRYHSIAKYYEIIQEENSNLVLFAGDVTGDGSCGHGFHYAFMLLLKLLEEERIHSAYIRGNHDEEDYYSLVIKFSDTLKYTQEISNTSVEIIGIKILGIDYFHSKSKTKLKKTIANYSDHYDIILAHSQLKRRIRLFEFNTDYIFTGHYDRKLLQHKNSVYVSLDNDAYEISYATIQKIKNRSDLINIKVKENLEVTISLEEDVELLKNNIRSPKLAINDTPTLEIDPIEKSSISALTNGSRDYSYLKFIRGTEYRKTLITMKKLKVEEELNESDLTLNEILYLQIINNYKISKSMIEDYLGDVFP